MKTSDQIASHPVSAWGVLGAYSVAALCYMLALDNRAITRLCFTGRQTQDTDMLFHFCDLDPVTLIFEHDPHIQNGYLHSKFLRRRFHKLEPELDAKCTQSRTNCTWYCLQLELFNSGVVTGMSLVLKQMLAHTPEDVNVMGVIDKMAVTELLDNGQSLDVILDCMKVYLADFVQHVRF